MPTRPLARYAAAMLAVAAILAITIARMALRDQTPALSAAVSVTPAASVTPMATEAPSVTMSPSPNPTAMSTATATAAPSPTPRPTPTPSATAIPGHTTTLADGRLRLDVTSLGLSVVYPPGSFAAGHLGEFVTNWQQADAAVRSRLQVASPAPMTVELRADGAADPLGLGVRGFSEPAQQRMYQLYDGSGDVGDRAYLTAHELGHMRVYQKAGWGADLMLAEGIAMYASDQLLRRDGLVTVHDFATAAYVQQRLVPLTTLSAPGAAFHGRLVDRASYDLAGSFVSYLIETYGLDKFLQVYPTAHYSVVYGKPLSRLEEQWVGFLAARARQQPLTFDSARYFADLDRLSAAYRRLYDAAGRHGDTLIAPAYAAVDAARLAVDRHDDAAAARLLGEFAQAMGSP